MNDSFSIKIKWISEAKHDKYVIFALNIFSIHIWTGSVQQMRWWRNQNSSERAQILGVSWFYLYYIAGRETLV